MIVEPTFDSKFGFDSVAVARIGYCCGFVLGEAKVRLFEESKHLKCQELSDSVQSFAARVKGFSSTVEMLMEKMSSKEKAIERAKMKAIGQRIRMQRNSKQ